jgi:hypothetical protein
MSIKINPFLNIEALNFLTKGNDKKTLIKSEIKSGFNAEVSTANNLHLFAGSLRKAQLFGKPESLNRVNNKITDPEKAATNLGEGFELTFYINPQDYYSQGESVKFTVKDGKFSNPDGYQLIFNKEKGYTEAVLLA